MDEAVSGADALTRPLWHCRGCEHYGDPSATLFQRISGDEYFLMLCPECGELMYDENFA